MPLPSELSGGPFTTARAAAAGVGEGRLRGGDLERPFHGVRMARSAATPVEAAVATVEMLCRAYAVRMRPVEAFSHRTAATLHGLPTPWSTDPVIEVVVLGPHGLPRSRGVRGHRADMATRPVVVRGLRVVSPVDTWLQLAADLGVRELVMIGDALVRRRQPLAAMGELVEAVSRHRGRRGHRALVVALAHVRPGTDSPAETELRLDLVEHGLPEPVVNLDILDASGRRIAIGDLAYPSYRVLVEYDGDHHRDDPAQYSRDVDRLDDLAHEGWRVIRFNRSHRGIRRTRRLERVRDALLAAGWKPPPG
jgi:Protein of unknown function (DUF559)